MGVVEVGHRQRDVVDPGDAPSRFVFGRLGADRQQLDHQPAQQPADDPPLLLAGRVQHRIERLSGDERFEDHVHAQDVAVERQCAVHVGDADDEVTERHVVEGHGLPAARFGAGRPANNGRSR